MIRFHNETDPALGLGHQYRMDTLRRQLGGGEGLPPLAKGVDIHIRDVAREYPPLPELRPALVVDVVDEAHEASGEADLVFAALGESGPGVYAGLRYAILRQEFSEQASRPWERDGLAVCLGGVDPSSATMRIAAALYGNGHGLRVVTVTGPGSEWGEGRAGPVWQVLSRSALAVVSGGTTLLECAATGTPALVLAHNDREEGRVRGMLASGYGWFRYLGRAATIDADHVRLAVERLASSAAAMDAMSRDGRARVDGCGAWRVGAILRRRIFELSASAESES